MYASGGIVYGNAKLTIDRVGNCTVCGRCIYSLNGEQHEHIIPAREWAAYQPHDPVPA